MADIVTRLRNHPHYEGSARPCEWCAAVAEIERLRAASDALYEAVVWLTLRRGDQVVHKPAPDVQERVDRALSLYRNC